MLGSWTVNVDAAGGMPEKVATAIGALAEQLIGAEYRPIAYLGSQLVNGINHAVLAEQTILSGRDTKNVVVLIFNEKGMDCTLVNIERVLEGGDGMGAVEVHATTDIPKDAQNAFDDVFGEWVGSTVKPFAYLGSQVVSGIDYIFAAELTLVTENPVHKVVSVRVNGLTKKVSFTDILK